MMPIARWIAIYGIKMLGYNPILDKLIPERLCFARGRKIGNRDKFTLP